MSSLCVSLVLTAIVIILGCTVDGIIFIAMIFCGYSLIGFFPATLIEGAV